jgi:hypothetical protein
MVGSLAGVTEMWEVAVVTVVGEHWHKISSKGSGIDQIFISKGGTGRDEKVSV